MLSVRNRAIFLIKAYLWTVAVFVIAKLGFMLYCRASADDLSTFTATDVWQVIRHGLSLDLSTALYFLIVPFLTAAVSIWWRNPRVLKAILRGYFIIVAIAFALAFAADTCLYPFWRFKLDASCLQYLETPADAIASVSTLYLIVLAVAFLLVCLLIYAGYHLCLLPFLQKDTASSSLRTKIIETLVYVLVIPLYVIGIRGGLDESTTNIGQVYYSSDQFLNHSAVNPVFCFLSSFEKSANNIVDYDYYPEDECRQLMAGLYPSTSECSDTLLSATRPDIVVILMESAGEVFAQAMPQLQELKREGISFNNCYANTWRTDRGTVCTYSGYPSFPTSSVMKMPRKTDALPGIAATLQQQGYNTVYLYGGDINFTNMRSYLMSTGFEKIVWKSDFTAAEQSTAKWGVRDNITFDKLYELLTTARDASPMLIGFSTLSSHQPWDVPIHQYDDEVLNAFYYLDQCIGTFIQKLRQTPRWKNTLVILLPDHSMDFDGTDESDIHRNLIPMVWTGGAVKTARQIDVICNQTDLPATLLSQLQLPHDDYRWSRNVLSIAYRYPFAVHNYNNGYSLIDSTGYIVYDLDSRRLVASHSSDSLRLERMGKAILQATTQDLKQLGIQN